MSSRNLSIYQTPEHQVEKKQTLNFSLTSTAASANTVNWNAKMYHFEGSSKFPIATFPIFSEGVLHSI